MDAVKFVKEYLRMCTKVDVCEDCPIYKTDFCTVPAKERSQESAEEIVELVEKWSAAHSRKTRQSVFLKQYPEAPVGDNGILRACPTSISAKYMDKRGRCNNMGRSCDDCKREFWMQEAE
jgi:hypothetical protein|nr:MAG TPA: 14-3-3 protein gamma [Caudoviricetes sp.]